MDEVRGSNPLERTIFFQRILPQFFSSPIMKSCESCFQGQANILYYESIGGRSRQIHLCQACAEKKGFDALPVVSPVTDLREKLELAILTEEFEEAARLRDLINGREVNRV